MSFLLRRGGAVLAVVDPGPPPPPPPPPPPVSGTASAARSVSFPSADLSQRRSYIDGGWSTLSNLAPLSQVSTAGSSGTTWSSSQGDGDLLPNGWITGAMGSGSTATATLTFTTPVNLTGKVLRLLMQVRGCDRNQLHNGFVTVTDSAGANKQLRWTTFGYNQWPKDRFGYIGWGSRAYSGVIDATRVASIKWTLQAQSTSGFVDLSEWQTAPEPANQRAKVVVWSDDNNGRDIDLLNKMKAYDTSPNRAAGSAPWRPSWADCAANFGAIGSFPAGYNYNGMYNASAIAKWAADGVQFGGHAYGPNEHNNAPYASGAALTKQMGQEFDALNAYNLPGREDFAFPGGGGGFGPNIDVFQKWRSGRWNRGDILTVETQPPCDPVMVGSRLNGQSQSQLNIAFMQQAIAERGIAQFTMHDSAFDTELAWLDQPAQRAVIDVVTWEQAITPWVRAIAGPAPTPFPASTTFPDPTLFPGS